MRQFLLDCRLAINAMRAKPKGAQQATVSFVLPSGSVIRARLGSHGSEGTGGELWPSGRALCNSLAQRQSWLQGCAVLDLGSGSGLAGLVAAGLGAPRVVLTDVDFLPMLSLNAEGEQEECQFRKRTGLMEQLLGSVDLNTQSADPVCAGAGRNTTVLPLKWGDAADIKGVQAALRGPLAAGDLEAAEAPVTAPQSPSSLAPPACSPLPRPALPRLLIMGSDIIYDKFHWPALKHTFLTLTAWEPDILISAQERGGDVEEFVEYMLLDERHLDHLDDPFTKLIEAQGGGGEGREGGQLAVAALRLKGGVVEKTQPPEGEGGQIALMHFRFGEDLAARGVKGGGPQL